MSNEVRKISKIKKIKKKFSEFTKKVWIQEVTEDTTGEMLNNKLQEVFELDRLYKEVKNKYDLLYKELNIRSNIKVNIWVILIFTLSLILNIYNFIMISKK